MSERAVTVVVPTLAADSALLQCLASLRTQTYQDFDVIVIDNSCMGAVRRLGISDEGIRIVENDRNVGFGAAVNQGWRMSASPLIATINDDATASPEWLAELVRAADSDPEIGSVASRVLLDGQRLDSAGMLIGGDGSSRQRGHGRQPEDFSRNEDVLMASGCAALFRRAMLDDIGGFDEDFFLYCEDTDLGLRARWRGWRSVYANKAVVFHRYSHSAGRASALKAFYVERNRLFVLAKNYPASMLWKAPFVTAARYAWHTVSLLRGRGTAGEFARTGASGFQLPWLVLRAHVDFARHLPKVLRDRRKIRERAYLSARQFTRLLHRHRISAREVAAL